MLQLVEVFRLVLALVLLAHELVVLLGAVLVLTDGGVEVVVMLALVVRLLRHDDSVALPLADVHALLQ